MPDARFLLPLVALALLCAGCSTPPQSVPFVEPTSQREAEEARASEVRSRIDDAGRQDSDSGWGIAFLDLPVGVHDCVTTINPPGSYLYFRIYDRSRYTGGEQLLVDEAPEGPNQVHSFRFRFEVTEDHFATWLDVEATGKWTVRCEE